MSASKSERLYALLPEFYRYRDGQQGQPLRALLALMEQELLTLEADIAELYDNWFIETCDEWLVPYIGDLLGVQGLSAQTGGLLSQRAHVANTIGYRRRKGAAAILEQVAEDVSGWHVRVVEFFHLLGVTQHLENVHPQRGRTVDLRDRRALDHIGGPFQSTAGLVDVRNAVDNRAHANITNLGLFVWRLNSYPISSQPARDTALGYYTFHPLGKDMPLFTRPEPQTSLDQISGETNVPGRISRQALESDLREHKVRTGQQVRQSRYYGRERSFTIAMGDAPLPADEIWSVGIGDDGRPESDIPPDSGAVAAVDVERGRFIFLDVSRPEKVLVSYHYGFSADIGGGPYNRRSTLVEPDSRTWVVRVDRAHPLDEALAQWRDRAGRTLSSGVINIEDNGVYMLPDGGLQLHAGEKLVIQAADGARPVITTGEQLYVNYLGSSTDLILNGLILEGDLQLDAPYGGGLHMQHCTLASQDGMGRLMAVNSQELQVTIERSLVGPLLLPEEGAFLTVRDSVVDAGFGVAIGPPEGLDPEPGLSSGPPTHLERVTILGKVSVQYLSLASEVIFTGEVQAARPQMGGVRFSYVPPGSQTPLRFRCQPEMASAGQPGAHIPPRFTSLRYGQPGYAQLSLLCPSEIRGGAENGSEMGAFHHLLQPQRVANMRVGLDEYMPSGLQASIIFVT